MKRVLVLLFGVMCLVGCEKQIYMSVANKTFYQEGYGVGLLTYFKFTNDSVFYKQSSYENNGTYVQNDDIITLRREKSPSTEHAIVKGDMLIFMGDFYVQDYPDY